MWVRVTGAWVRVRVWVRVTGVRVRVRVRVRVGVRVGVRVRVRVSTNLLLAPPRPRAFRSLMYCRSRFTNCHTR